MIEGQSDNSDQEFHVPEVPLYVPPTKRTIVVDSNPDVDITALAKIKYEEFKDQYGLVPFQTVDQTKKVQTGTVERYAIPEAEFDQEYINFKKHGYSVNPNPNVKGLIFDEKKFPEFKKLEVEIGAEIEADHPLMVETIYNTTSKKARQEKAKLIKQKRDNEAASMYAGPWAGYGQNLVNGDLTAEQKQNLIKAEERRKIRIQEAKKQEQDFQPFSEFHWKQTHDYKGKSFIEAPSDLKKMTGNCYIPKKCTTTWIASKVEGYQVMRFFPNTGHFLIAGNAEGHVKLYDVNKNRTCAQTYVGHTKAIRDVAVSNDGKNFLSASFDKVIHYWDTETGKVLRTFKLKKYPFCVKFDPEATKQNVFLAGGANNKISQFDLNSGTKVLQYDQHLSTVNTITWIEPKKFVSSSDDKKLFVWEFGIPVVYKHVSQPEMHAVTAAVLHPNGEYFAGQSSDNQVVIYEAKGGNFRRNRAKKFANHRCAGYACGISFSSDGQFLVSGDERGKLYFYDWKTSKNYRTTEAHPKVCIGAQWNPNDPTMVATCGWQGLIKLWE